MNTLDTEVIIVGAGPTGLTAASLLARHGVESVVLDRWHDVYPQPRAVHLDGEIRRILARLGIDEAFAALSRPALGLRLVDPALRVLAQFDRDPAGGRNGFPEANLFDQPDLEAVLRSNARRHAEITIRGGIEVTGAVPENDWARVDYTDRTSGATASIRGRYVLGCDGANSVVRSSIGSAMRDLGFEQRWLVVDIATTAELGAWEGVHQVCDPARAATYMRIGATRYRWEFRLLPGESDADFQDIADLHPLIRPWTKTIQLDELQLVRVAEYISRAQIADRWQAGSIFLLGDAAHLTPPFIGQGMGAGVRDAANLAWKLAAVLSGSLPPQVLSSYEIERKPHARSLIRLAELIGRAMTEGGEFGNVLRRLILPRLIRIPGFTGVVTGDETPPLRRSALNTRRRFGRGLAGTLIPNVLVDADRRFDTVAGGRYTLVTVAEPTLMQRTEIARRGAVLVPVEAGSELGVWLRRKRSRAALIRPDGTVQTAARTVGSVLGALPASGSGPAGLPRSQCGDRPDLHRSPDA
ncbi:bifunctional 3-(3-hydroxy-phenyl)propionate/3-hydroxycinnamic acid hydroxylase [Nocardia aobensis]|uniref:Bifunctional 3-(3-hydroxy-phenyl)propionate/3-hydroxycinnamic acid hydroxylase n=1 Tax=Nocardia aobensis TaxID=257277 RepID=A0ABW6NZU1_9NOCA